MHNRCRKPTVSSQEPHIDTRRRSSYKSKQSGCAAILWGGVLDPVEVKKEASARRVFLFFAR